MSDATSPPGTQGGIPNTHPPAHLCCLCSQPHHRSARPQARIPHCGDRPPPLGGTAEAGARHSPLHPSHRGSQGPHHSAEPGPHTAHCGRGIQMGCTSSALWAEAGMTGGTVSPSPIGNHPAGTPTCRAHGPPGNHIILANPRVSPHPCSSV